MSAARPFMKKEGLLHMAKEIGGNGKTTQAIKEQVDRERNILFLVAKIVMVVATVAYVGYALFTGYSDYQTAIDFEERGGNLSRSLETLKAEVEAWHEENDNKPDAIDEEAGVQIEYRDMYSAWNAGNEVAYLQNEYYKKKEMLQDDRRRLNELTKNTECWIGASWNAVATPLRWDFVTFYDATDKTYDVAWECWHEAPSGTMYLIAVQFASYDGENGMFRMGSMYQTDFARMLSKKGAIEAGDPVQMSSSPAQQMYQEIMSHGGTGQPSGDDEDFGGAVHEFPEEGSESSDESGDGTSEGSGGSEGSGEIAGGAGGGQ